MNERIRELAEQSMGTRKYVPPVWQFFDNELQKFAELIVQECIEAILEWKREPFPFEPDDAARLLREHFVIKDENI
jgi:hypothetical protein